MKRANTLSLLMCLYLSGCGIMTEGPVYEGQPIPQGEVPCKTVSDCWVDEPVCRTVVECGAAGLCIYEDQPKGTLIVQQIPGDCLDIICDGAGHTQTNPALGDLEDDENPCTLDECSADGPTHTPQPQIQVDCYTGPAGTKDIGVCKGGIQQCDAQGNLAGSCEGEVIPEAEACQGDLDDEDCDGQVNEEGAGCVCMPGMMQDCYTGDPATKDIGQCVGGQQTCNAEGTAFGPCVGEVIQGNEVCKGDLVDEDCDGQVNEEGMNCVCVPGMMQDCYTGDPATKDIGQCVGGQQTCNAEGMAFGPCMGETIPGAEVCNGDSVDEDCDGQVNEEGAGCVCVPGAIEACYTGPAGTSGVGICASGQRACAMDGLGFGSCMGEQTPLLTGENCESFQLDEDCDGQVNEEGPDCQCGDGYISVGEQCDDGNQISTDGCTMACKLPVCGDGFTQPIAGETCDDGGTQDGDICSPTCQEQKVLAIDSGGSSTCALLSGGVVKCWGKNDFGQLGLGNVNHRGDQAAEMGGNLPAVNLGTGKTASAVSVGGTHACALLTDGSVKCWGRNNVGQLGQGDTQNRGDDPNEMGDQLNPVPLGTGKLATVISAGGEHTCALLNDNTVKCWGNNDLGLLGHGNNNATAQGDSPAEMGDALPVVALGTGVYAMRISAGNTHTCAVLNNNTVKCWGLNSVGQLGLNDMNPRGQLASQMGNNLPVVDLGVGLTAVTISAGNDHTCVRMNDNKAKCWGWGLYGQLGQNSKSNIGDGVGPSVANTAAVNLGAGYQVEAVRAGHVQTCAILSSGKVKCWGSLYYGQLGLMVGIAGGGMDVAIGSDPMEMENLPQTELGTANYLAFDLSVGSNFGCAAMNYDIFRVKCWGLADYGQVGLEDSANNRGDLANEMGDNLPFVKLFSNVW